MERHNKKECRHWKTDTPEALLNHRLHQCGHYLYHHSAGHRQIKVLHLLQENGPMSQKDIQEAMGIQSGSISELISKLESKRLVERSRETEDRRKVVLALTERGKSMQFADEQDILKSMYHVLTAEEIRQLTLMLEKLLDSWEE